MSAAPLDWPGLLRAGLCTLRLTPAEFWALTPHEFMLMLGPPGPAPMARGRLLALLRDFPDSPEEPAP